MEPIPENAVPLQERRFKHAGQLIALMALIDLFVLLLRGDDRRKRK